MYKIFFLFISKKRAPKVIFKMAKYFKINLQEMLYHAQGISKYQTSELSGEAYLLNNILPSYFEKLNNKPVIFDVGANTGEYFNELISKFQQASIFAFEPNPNCFNSLKKIAEQHTNTKVFEIGFGASETTSSMFSYANESDSEHASLFKEVLTDLHKTNDVQKIDIQISTIDKFCQRHQIEKINFLKIDTEGYELEVIKGASEMIAGNKIDLIQFEFNEMNIVSKVFLKDFYDKLSDYSFFRLDSNRLIPLLEYNANNEIFCFQNIFAVNKKIDQIQL
jgi:FkbM family methyltransferase